MATPRWVLMGRRFCEQALVDLDSARENVRPRRYHNAMMFAEQAAEKALKAGYWHLLAEEPPWKHALEPLAARLTDMAGQMPTEVALAIGQIETQMERIRYPSGNVNDPIPADAADEMDARTAITHAETVMKWAASLLQLPSGKPKGHKNS